MFDERSREQWPDSSDWVVQGELDGKLVVSLPVTTSIESMNRIADDLEKEFKKPVLAVNHNMELLLAQRLPTSEAAEVLKRIDDYAKARREAINQEAKSAAADGRADDRTDRVEQAGVGGQ